MKEEVKEVLPVEIQEKKFPQKRQGNQGRVLFVANGKVFIEYGKGFGTSISYLEKEHANLKEGDQIFF